MSYIRYGVIDEILIKKEFMISYIGGKSIIGKWIRNYIPTDIETYVETFGGMFWVYFCMEDKYPNLKNIVYNDFNQLNSNLFKNVMGSNYKEFGELLLTEDCQQYRIPDTIEELELHKNKFIEYQKEIFKDGFIITDEMMRTNIDGIYAAGDIRVKQIRQIATAISDGMIAAINIERDLFR